MAKQETLDRILEHTNFDFKFELVRMILYMLKYNYFSMKDDPRAIEPVFKILSTLLKTIVIGNLPTEDEEWKELQSSLLTRQYLWDEFNKLDIEISNMDDKIVNRLSSRLRR